MNPLSKMLVCVGTALATLVSSALAAPSEFWPTDDTFIYWRYPDGNYGSSNRAYVANNYAWPGNQTNYQRDMLVRFDLSELPQGSPVDNATLYLYYYEWEDNNPAGRSLACHRITEAWTEDTVTWNTRPGLASEATSTAVVPGSPGTWMAWDVTSDIHAFLNDPGVHNYGWEVSDPAYWGAANIPVSYFRTKENGAFIPYLTVEWCSAPDCLLVDGGNVELWGNHLYNAVYVINGGSINVPDATWNSDLQEWEGGYLMLEADTIYVDSSSSIHADACGFSKDDGHSDGGLGHGEDFEWDEFHGGYGGGEGAGHGGRGGACQWTTPFGNGGEPYGSAGIDPCNELGYCDPDSLFGSAGGDYIRWTPILLRRGGCGGGYVRLIAHEELTIEGNISANGGDGLPANDGQLPPGAGSGGGSGGYIVLSSPTINLNGTLSARGGDGSDPGEAVSAGGGAGGCIIVAGSAYPVCVSASAVAGGFGGCYGAGDGNPGTVHLPSVASPPPVITGLVNDSGRYPDDLLTNDATVAGTAEPESLIRLYVNGAVVGSGAAVGTGDFAVTITGSVVDGEIEVTATAQEPCANESAPSASFTFSLDRTPPAAPSVPDLHPNSDTGRYNDDNVTRDWGPYFQGTSEPDMDIKLCEGTTELGTAYTMDGNWQVTSSALSEGTHLISATALDAAGNESTASSTLLILVDVTDPVISNPVVTPTNCPHPSMIFDVQVTVTDALSGVQDASAPGVEIWLDESLVDWFSLDALGGGLFASPWDSSGQVAGTYSVAFEAFDLAGNVNRFEDAAILCLAVPADIDEDGDVDLDDFSIFTGCMMGPEVSYPGGCEYADFESDLDVDVADFAFFQTAFTEP